MILSRLSCRCQLFVHMMSFLLVTSGFISGFCYVNFAAEYKLMPIDCV